MYVISLFDYEDEVVLGVMEGPVKDVQSRCLSFAEKYANLQDGRIEIEVPGFNGYTSSWRGMIVVEIKDGLPTDKAYLKHGTGVWYWDTVDNPHEDIAIEHWKGHVGG